MTAYDLAMTDILRRIAELSTLVETIHKSVTGRLSRLEDAQSLAITEASMVLAAQFHERQRADKREREADWKRTRDAAVQGILANPEHADISNGTLALDAKLIADEANGPLDVVVMEPISISAESFAKPGKLFELAMYPRDHVNALVEAAERVLQRWSDYTCQEMYGEMLRDGMADPNDEAGELCGPDDFDRWEAAHDALREAHKPFETP